DIDQDLWTETSHNPVKMLYRIPQEKLDALASDEAFLFRMEKVVKKLDLYSKRPCWYEKIKDKLPADNLIAYFSAEFGLAECLPIYSGGLGVLAGDHLKSASDLGLPFIAVGLLYSQGYFHQYLTSDGWQQEKYIVHDYNLAPIKKVCDENGVPFTLDLYLPHGTVKFQVWKVQVGRIELYLLDTNLPENSQADRDITSKLYGGDLEMRIKQEFLLGIGGMIALKAIGLNPTVTHMNEGHSAFLALERVRLLIQEKGLTFDEASEFVSASSVFTTHTPVPAGNDRFPKELMERYLKNYVESNLKISFSDFLKLGRVIPDDEKEWFCMTVLALKMSHHNNGVSKLHGHVSRNMWKDIWKNVPLDEVPIKHVTNGIHMPSWISNEIAELFTRYLGTKWEDTPDDHQIWQRIDEIPNTELWRTHERRKERLVSFARRTLKEQLKARGASHEEIDASAEALSPDALTIGFARRFATYKRATLIFRDIERLSKILSDKDRPVQFIFAGKAHPKDDAGKEFIKQVVQMSEKDEFRGKIVFLEDYDLHTAHYLTQGVDVWMNNPRRPLEASGTSGMKVIFNGGLNFSIKDGWWDEKPDADNGWNIGRGEEYEDIAYQDEVESNSIYEILENDIIPTFYKRGKDDQPNDWIKKMKISMTTLSPVFNTHRQVMEYTEMFYKPAGLQHNIILKSDYEKAKEIAKWKYHIARNWSGLNIESVYAENNSNIKVGEKTLIKTEIQTAGLSEKDILAEIYYGYNRGSDSLVDINTVPMKFTGDKDGKKVFEAYLEPGSSGKVNYTVRVLPSHPDLPIKFIPGYIKWAK
ncbi:MAG TPA: glycosyltransferase family 1 protein, partial [Firmicutes bacterium]|nr:glycosyltransferase family 1 protein [Bacillota bacterium]